MDDASAIVLYTIFGELPGGGLAVGRYSVEKSSLPLIQYQSGWTSTPFQAGLTEVKACDQALNEEVGTVLACNIPSQELPKKRNALHCEVKAELAGRSARWLRSMLYIH